MAELARFLERRIEELNISEHEAARRWNIPQPTLRKILRNPDRIPKLPTLKRLAEGMGEQIDKLAALAGFPAEDMPQHEEALLGLTEEQIAWWLTIPPTRRSALLDALRQLYEDDRGR